MLMKLCLLRQNVFLSLAYKHRPTPLLISVFKKWVTESVISWEASVEGFAVSWSQGRGLLRSRLSVLSLASFLSHPLFCLFFLLPLPGWCTNCSSVLCTVSSLLWPLNPTNIQTLVGGVPRKTSTLPRISAVRHGLSTPSCTSVPPLVISTFSCFNVYFSK